MPTGYREKNWGWTRGPTLAAALGVVCCAGGAGAQTQSVGPGRALAIDRWLIATPFDAADAPDPLAREYLGSEAETYVLPERGAKRRSAVWKLVRRDSVEMFDLDSLFPTRPRQAVIYAHAYVRSPEDRTLRLAWHGPSCGGSSVWLNGQRIPRGGRSGDTATVRLARGWNTLLLKTLGSDCPYRLGASLQAGALDGLDGLRVQASRPPGAEHRAPAPWVTGSPLPTIETFEWHGDELVGDLQLRLTTWGEDPLPDLEIKVKVGKTQLRPEAPGSPPAAPTSIFLPVPFEDVRRAALGGDGVRTELRWDKQKVEWRASLTPERILRRLHGPILLSGWQQIPADSGLVLRGAWRVPAALSGFTLELTLGDAVDRVELNGAEASPTGGRVRLCAPCEKEAPVALRVVTGDTLEAPPTARIVDPGYPESAGAPEAPGARKWLRLLDDHGSRRYRELGARLSTKASSAHGPGASGG